MLKDSSRRPCVVGTVYERGKPISVLVPFKYQQEYFALQTKNGGTVSKADYDRWMLTVDERYPQGTVMDRVGIAGMIGMACVAAFLLLLGGLVIIGMLDISPPVSPGSSTSTTVTPEQKKQDEKKQQEDQKKQDEKKAKQAEKDRLAALKAHRKDSSQKAFFKTYKKKFACKYDEFKDRDICRCKTSPKYVNMNGAYMCFVKSDEQMWFRFSIQYLGSRFLFIDNYEFLIDGKTYEFTPTAEIDRVSNDGQVWEDLEVDAGDALEILDPLRKAKSASIRHHGSKYYDDRKMSKQELANIKTMMDVYDLFER